MQNDPEIDAQDPYRKECCRLLDEGDWHALYKAAMGWRVAGGGMWTPDAWLMDICSALLHKQPKTAIHCCDMALRTWIGRPLDRLTLRYVRGLLILDHARDPIRSLDDLHAARQGQAWLTVLADEDSQRAELAAARSKVKTPRVGPSPQFTGEHRAPGIAPAPQPLSQDGSKPPLWEIAIVRIRSAAAGT